jgi:hypothetical protein
MLGKIWPKIRVYCDLRSIAPMSIPRPYPSLKPLHPHSSLRTAKLAQLERIPSEVLKESLLPGRPDSLKTRPDGTILDGHHRIYIPPRPFLSERKLEVSIDFHRSRGWGKLLPEKALLNQ